MDLFDFTVSGRGGHGSQPQNTTDPVLAAAQMIVMMQQIVARRVDPMEMAVFSLGSIHGGDAPNVIPAEVKFGGVTRAYSESVRSVIKEQVQAIAKGIEAASGNTVHIHYADGYPSAFNDKELMDLAADAVRKELGEDAVVPMPDPMPFSEDFSFYGKLGGIPSAYLMLYAGHEGELEMCIRDSHHSDFARSSIENGYQMVKELFAKPIDYTAIFASTDSNALGILKAADELHIRIPGDLSLIGFDNIPSTALPRIDLTTIEQPKKRCV